MLSYLVSGSLVASTSRLQSIEAPTLLSPGLLCFRSHELYPFGSKTFSPVPDAVARSKGVRLGFLVMCSKVRYFFQNNSISMLARGALVVGVFGWFPDLLIVVVSLENSEGFAAFQA
jgi:hypothetical protein